MTDPKEPIVDANSEPRQILATLEQRARRRFGQHFLTRMDVVQRIVRGADVRPGDRVVEIGPGLGVLTKALLDAGAEVTAVELDRDLAAWLRGAFAYAGDRFRLVEGDAVRVNWAETCPGAGWKCVSNLPYNVGTTLVVELLRRPETFASVTVMLQKEVVDRMLAGAADEAYGSLSVYVTSRAEGRWITGVPPGAFHPPPKVSSGVVRLELLAAPRVGPAGVDGFERVVRAAFAQRRKTIVNSLATAFDKEAALAALGVAGIDPGVRAERLDHDAFMRLAGALWSSPPA